MNIHRRIVATFATLLLLHGSAAFAQSISIAQPKAGRWVGSPTLDDSTVQTISIIPNISGLSPANIVSVDYYYNLGSNDFTSGNGRVLIGSQGPGAGAYQVEWNGQTTAVGTEHDSTVWLHIELVHTTGTITTAEHQIKLDNERPRQPPQLTFPSLTNNRLINVTWAPLQGLDGIGGEVEGTDISGIGLHDKSGHRLITDNSPSTVLSREVNKPTLSSTIYLDGDASLPFYIHIRSGDSNRNTNGQNWTDTQHFGPITLDLVPPTLTITPDGDCVGSAPVTFTFTFGEDVVGFDQSDIGVPGGVTLANFQTVSAQQYTVDVTNPPPSLTVNVGAAAAQDAAGNNSPAASASITFDGVPPTATLSPIDGQTNVDPGANLVLTFNENVTAGTGNIELRKFDDDSLVQNFVVPGGILVAGNIVTLDPTASLQGNTHYYVLIPNTALADDCGNAFAGFGVKTDWDFTTSNNPPVAVGDTITIGEDGPAQDVTAQLLANDSDPDNNTITVFAINTAGTTGQATFASPNVSYDPNDLYESLDDGETAVDTFIYTISDGTDTDTAVVTVIIHGANDCPVAVDDTDSTDEDSTTTGDVETNDTDVDVETLTASNASGATGTVNLAADGSYTYDPNGQFESLDTGETATDSFTYVISDGTCTDVGTVVIVINGVNDCPVAVADTGSTDEDSTTTGDVESNDTDVDVETLTASNASGATGTVNLAADGSYTYDPNGQFESLDTGETATDSFTYVISDGTCTDVGTVVIVINGVNDCPVAVADTDSTDEDSTTTGDVETNDTDVDVETLTASNASGATGTVNLAADGSYTYDPNGQFENLDTGETATDSFTYVISDGTCTDVGTVVIVINGVNDCPVAVADTDSTDEDSTTTGDVETNDTDVDVETLTASNASGATGTVNLAADGSYTYDPNGQFESLDTGETATDSFTYVISDGTCTDVGTVVIVINGVNDCPVAVADTDSTDEDSTTTGDVESNDTDVDGETLTASNASGATGTVNLAADGSYTYDPNGQFESLDTGETATDSFTYVISDGTCTDVGTVVIVINGVNDCPVAVDDTDSTDEDSTTTGDVETNDTDVDVETLTASNASGATGTVNLAADGSYTYDPNGQFESLDTGETATDSFTYVISDGTCTDVGTVVIVINGVNDCPVAVADTDSTDEDSTTTGDVETNDTDVDVETLTASNASGATGTVNLAADGNFTYDPNGQFESLDTGETATDSFTYVISDGTCTDVGTVVIVINGVNDCPVAVADTDSTDEDSTTTGDVETNDTDVDVETLTASNASGATGTVNLAADGSYTYDPNGQFENLDTGETATDSFTYVISDGTCTDVGTVVIVINGVNDCPVAVADTDSTDEDSTTTGDVETNDTDVDVETLTASNASGATGTVNLAADGSYTYDPNGQFESLDTGETATDSFTYVISDGTCTDVGTVVIVINGVNDCPVAVANTDSTDEDSTTTGDVETNDTDVDVETLTASNASGATGTVNLAADGSYTYDPNGQFESLDTGETATDSFTYVISDGTCTDVGTVVIVINGVNDCPVAVADTDSTDEDSTTTGDVETNDTDVDVETLTASNASGATGTVNLAADGSYTYDPNGQFESLDTGETATDSFTYVISDGTCTDVGTVVIVINGVNDCPVAVADTDSTDEDSTTTGDVETNDTDVDVETLTASNASGATGTVNLAADGSYTYDPNGQFESLDTGETATDSFTYVISDSTCTDVGTVVIVINGVNDCPVAVADTDSTDEDSTTTGDVETNDTDVDGETLTASNASGATGTVNLAANGSYTYDPNGQFESLDTGETATDSFTYVISDGTCTDVGTVVIVINGVNDCPVAVADTDSTDEDSTTTGDVETNDTDVDVETLTASNASGATGTVNLAANGSYTYDPNGQFESLDTGETATDSFTYVISDGTCTDVGTVVIVINGVNDCPVAVADTDSTDEDSTTTGDVETNDTDVDVETLTASNASGATGTVNLAADGSYTYDPNGQFESLDTGETATDSFTYVISDGTCTDVGTVVIVINGVNDCPVANNDTASFGEDDGSGNVNVLTGSGSFSPTQQVITTAAHGARSVYATDLDGDGDADVLSASAFDDTIAWYENLGGGSFGPQQVITAAADGAYSVYATDLDGDGDADVLSASAFDNKIAWYENDGSGSFGPQQVITAAADGARSVYATDLDGDGDADVLSASASDDTIAWYENLGGGSFGTQQVITAAADGAWSVYATDLDGDGDADVLSASLNDDKIAWYENDGSGSFGPQQVITAAADGARSVYATDLDGDGDADVLSASAIDDKIAWYENDGSGSFGPQQVITAAADNPYIVYATDLDGDGDADVLSASAIDDKIAWYENDGSGSFGPQQVITAAADGARSVYATDLDGDGDADVLSASNGDGTIAWYENSTLNTGTDIDVDGETLNVISVDDGSTTGNVSLAGGVISYDPNGQFENLDDGETATDSFTYIVSDGDCSDQATVTIVINGVNDCPVAVADTDSTDEDSTTTGDVETNDTDVDGETLTASNASGATGTVNLAADGSYTYDPNGQFENLDTGETATDSFTYVISDGTCTDVGTVVIVINGVNDCPVAVADTDSTDEDSTTTGDVESNDTDVDGETLTASNASGATGTVNLAADGSYTYDPNGQFESLDTGETATDSFTYVISDGTCTDVGTVVIVINGVNDCPVAVADTDSTDEDSTTTGDVESNDTDVDVETLTASNASGATGTVNLAADGSYTYDPNGQFESLDTGETATDRFTYVISDGTCTDVGTVVIVINGVNDCPVAVDDTDSTDEDSTTTGDVETNDTDVDGETLTASNASGATGTVNLAADGSYTYDPNGQFESLDTGETATDSFTYVISDGTCTDVGTVVIVINGVNDCPVAVADTDSTDEDSTTTGDVETNDTDVDGETLTASNASGATGTVNLAANGSYTYDPNGQFESLDTGETATDSFTYVISDGTCTDVGTVVIVINGVNDCPVAVADTDSTDEDSTTTGDVETNDTDVDVETLTASNASGATGTVNLAADGSYTYDPNGQFESLDTGETATDSFTYVISDGTCTDVGTVVIVINGVNDCPVAVADTDSTDEDSTTTGDVEANDTDVDGDTLTASNASVAIGNVTLMGNGNFTYDPNGQFEDLDDGETATDSFTYILDDGDCTDQATVVITITGVNDAPTCTDDAFTVLEGGTFDSAIDLLMVAPGAGSLLDNDDDVDASDVLSATKVTDPMWGTLTVATDGTFTYVHDDSENFVDSFMYRTTDLAGESCSATVTIFIQPVNRIRIDGQADPVRENHWVTLDVAVESPALQTLVFAIDYNHGTTRHLDYNYKVERVGTDIPVNADIIAVEDDSEHAVTKLWVGIDGNTQNPQTSPTVGETALANNDISEVVLRITMRVAIGSRLGDITPTVDLDSLLAYDANGMDISHTFINPAGLTPVIVDTEFNPLDGDENGFFDTVDAAAYYRASLWGHLNGLVPMVATDLRASGLPIRANDKEIIANFRATDWGETGADLNFDGLGPSARSATDLTYLFRRALAQSAGLPDLFTVPASHGLDPASVDIINQNIDDTNQEDADIYPPSLAFGDPAPYDPGPKGELDSPVAPITICYNESLRVPATGLLHTDATVNGGFIRVEDNGSNDITVDVEVTIDATARVLTITPIGAFTWPPGTITVIVDRLALLDVAGNLDLIGPADEIEVEAP